MDNRLQQVTELLYLEADLLDRANLDEWVDLYAPQGTYWMPVTPDQENPIDHISLFFDDRTIMEIRRRNLNSSHAASKELAIRCSHILGNIRILESQTDNMTVSANFHCAVFTPVTAEQPIWYAGKYRHELTRVNQQWRIAHKRVDIINCDAVLGTMLIYL